MKKLNWNNIRLLLMLVAVVLLYAFSLEKNNNRAISELEINFLGDSRLFITEETVNKLLIEKIGQDRTIVKDELILKALEDVLTKNQTIESSEVFVTIDGKLNAEVKQKTPIARIYDRNSSFYIDYQGTKMPLSDNFSARVPLVSGRFSDDNKAELTRLFRHIYDDEFLKKNIISIEVKGDQDIILKNRNYNYDIVFGKPTGIEEKFSNYKAFFQKASQDTLIGMYSQINLKFTKQVVCTKK